MITKTVNHLCRKVFNFLMDCCLLFVLSVVWEYFYLIYVMPAKFISVVFIYRYLLYTYHNLIIHKHTQRRFAGIQVETVLIEWFFQLCLFFFLHRLFGRVYIATEVETDQEIGIWDRWIWHDNPRRNSSFNFLRENLGA